MKVQGQRAESIGGKPGVALEAEDGEKPSELGKNRYFVTRYRYSLLVSVTR